MLTSGLLLAVIAAFEPPPEPFLVGPPSILPAEPITPDLLCAGEPLCLEQRWVEVDYEALGFAWSGADWIAYDLDEVTRSLSVGALDDEPALSVAVRLLLSEVGAARLPQTKNGLIEAVGVLYTVKNRLDPAAANPLAVPGHRGFPGCGEGGTFSTCANPRQYLGLRTWRATRPASGYPDWLIERAVDRAVIAWHLMEQGLVPDYTGGATNFVHRCGGAAYGETTWHCDGSMARGVRDTPGAVSHTGPISFMAPHELAPGGYYRMRETVQIDYVPVNAGG